MSGKKPRARLRVDYAWERVVVLSVVRIDILRGHQFTSIDFLMIPEEEQCAWITAVNRKEWVPNEHLWLCSEHFVSGEKSNDPLSPDYAPTIFQYVSSHLKRKKKLRI